MAKSEASVEELVSMIERGELRLPEMQRQYVWRSTRVRDLMDSLYRGYPSGAVLLWETDEAVPLRDFAVDQERNPYQSTRLLLDGQQRLTSLASVVRGKPINVRGRQRPIELLFNLEHPGLDQAPVVTEVNENDEDEDGREEDEADSSEDELQKRFDKMIFVVSTRKLALLPHWVKVSEVFTSGSDRPFLKRAGIKDFDDERGEKYASRLARLRDIRNYVYRMDVLERRLSYEQVTEIFVRVNSLGAKLRSSDLALAQITARWRGALDVFQTYQIECARSGFDIDLGLHLKNLVAFATGQSRFLTVGRLSIESLQSAWAQSVRGMDFALNFLRSNVGIDAPALLSSPFLLVTLAYYGHRHGFEIKTGDEQLLRSWALLANAKGRYSRGSTETLLDQDLATIRDGGGVLDLIDRLRLQVGRLDISAEDLDGRNQRSALFKTMFLAFRSAGAKDWHSNLSIAMSHRGSQHQLQFHHIFPKAVLRGSYTPREADDIANLAFIGGKTNRRISDKPPQAYFPELIQKAGPLAMAAQCIPTDEALLGVESYKGFLIARRHAIAQRLNEFLGTAELGALTQARL